MNTPVPLGSLEVGEKFRVSESTYRVEIKAPAMVTVRSVTVGRLRYLSPATVVYPVTEEEK